jgi:hypothetical protein
MKAKKHKMGVFVVNEKTRILGVSPDDKKIHIQKNGRETDIYIEKNEKNENVFFIEKSLYFTYTPPLSIQGENFLLINKNNQPIDDMEHSCYCLGPEWFDDKPPYIIYSVKTGQQITK